jgi:hypothetical protein
VNSRYLIALFTYVVKERLGPSPSFLGRPSHHRSILGLPSQIPATDGEFREEKTNSSSDNGQGLREPETVDLTSLFGESLRFRPFR